MSKKVLLRHKSGSESEIELHQLNAHLQKGRYVVIKNPCKNMEELLKEAKVAEKEAAIAAEKAAKEAEKAAKK